MDYRDLNALIEQLRDAVEETAPQKGYWGKLWTLARQIQQEFKESRFPTRADREAAWNNFNELRNLARQRSESDRVRMHEREQEWEKKRGNSSRARSAVEGKAFQTRPSTDIERAIAAPILIPLQLIDAMLRNVMGLEQPDHVKQELLACHEKMREAWTLFGESKNELLPADKAQTYKTLSDAQARLDSAWARWKDESHRLWTLKQEEWEKRKKEREEKHQLFVQRVAENIEKLEGRLGSATSALKRHEARLEKLQSDLDNARSESFKERCSGWIEECEEKIADIQGSISRLTSWIDEEKAKLR
jgi:hypothetical protein